MWLHEHLWCVAAIIAVCILSVMATLWWTAKCWVVKLRDMHSTCLSLRHENTRHRRGNQLG